MGLKIQIELNTEIIFWLSGTSVDERADSDVDAAGGRGDATGLQL